MDGRSGLPSPPLATSHRDRTHPSPPVRALATTTGPRRKPRGFAFVEFYNPDDAEEARIKLDKTDVHGREIQVMFAQNRRKRPEEMSTMDRNRGGGGGGGGRYGGGGDRYGGGGGRDRDRYDDRRRDDRDYDRGRGRSRSRSRSPPRRRSRSRSRSRGRY